MNPTMKSHLAILRELRRVKKVKADRRKKGQLTDPDFRSLYGAEQALSWALGENAMAPAKCFSPVKGR